MTLGGTDFAFGQTAAQGEPASPASQQNTIQTEGIAEIVVTAQRRVQNLQDVPVAVTAVAGELLLERGVANLTDLPNLSPGLRAAKGKAPKIGR